MRNIPFKIIILLFLENLLLKIKYLRSKFRKSMLYAHALATPNTLVQSSYIKDELKTTKQYQHNKRKSHNNDHYLLNNKPIAKEGG
jgi:hypothetical protein